MTEDALGNVLALLETQDLAALCAAGPQGRALVERFLKMQHGHRFERYMECSVFTRKDDCESLLRFAEPCTSRPFLIYQCGVCGGPTTQIGECPCRYLRFFMRTRHAPRFSPYNRCTAVASFAYFSFLMLWACGTFGWNSRVLCCVSFAGVLYFSFLLSSLCYSVSLG
tara:strand:- start:832 stop:1335 length:504 start_codon:yes stop_codon:yes gene_type:complete